MGSGTRMRSTRYILFCETVSKKDFKDCNKVDIPLIITIKSCLILIFSLRLQNLVQIGMVVTRLLAWQTQDPLLLYTQFMLLEGFKKFYRFLGPILWNVVDRLFDNTIYKDPLQVVDLTGSKSARTRQYSQVSHSISWGLPILRIFHSRSSDETLAASENI